MRQRNSRYKDSLEMKIVSRRKNSRIHELMNWNWQDKTKSFVTWKQHGSFLRFIASCRFTFDCTAIVRKTVLN